MEVNRVGIDLFKDLLTPDARSAHLLAFGAAFGAQAWVSFVAGPTMLAALPRQTFGNLMAKVFPVYFTYNAALSAFLVGTLAYEHQVIRKHPFDIFDQTVYQAFTLATGVVCHLVNGMVVGPNSTKLMEEIHAQEKAEGKSVTDNNTSDRLKKLGAEFAGLHSTSTILNFAAFGGLVFHGLWLAKKSLPWSNVTRAFN